MVSRTIDAEKAFPVDGIERLVNQFYGRIREDAELGPIFDARIDDWPFHLDRMVGFWRAVLRSEPAYSVSERGAPPQLHRAIDGLTEDHFARWLSIFSSVAAETFPGNDAEVLAAADRIAKALMWHCGLNDNESSDKAPRPGRRRLV